MVNRKIVLISSVIIIALILCYSLGYYFAHRESKITCKDCNVILISLDTLRADHLGSYGYFRDTSPNIDTLAEKSMVFKNAFSQSSHTTASHMSIFTSLHPSAHGMKIPWEDRLNPGAVTLAQFLKINDYTTVWVAPVDDYALNLGSGFSRGFDYFIPVKWKSNQTWDEGLEWMKKNKDNKFFMFFHNYHTHLPYVPPESTVLRFTDKKNGRLTISEKELNEAFINRIVYNPSLAFKEDVIKDNEDKFNNKSLLRASLMSSSFCHNFSILHRTCEEALYEMYWENFDLHNDSDMEHVKLLYDSEIYEADQDVGKLIDTLEKEGLMDKTIIVLTSDHGEEFMEHGGISHSGLYDDVIHIPLIIWIPDVGGKETSSLVQGVDIMPTILDLIGVDTPKQAQGVSLLLIIEGQTTEVNEYVYGDTFSYLSSIRSNEWKYITNFRNIEELYNLKKDPFERNNLAVTKPEIAGHMKNKLEEHLNKVGGKSTTAS